MKTLKLKLISLIAMVCLVLGLVVVGIYAAEIQYIELGGNITFNVDDKSLYVQDVRMQEDNFSNPYSLKEQGNFIPGYINGEFNMNLGSFTNDFGGFSLYFDIINTVDESGNSYVYDVTASTGQTADGVEVQVVVDNEDNHIPPGTITPSEITSTTSPTATVILTITSPQGVEVDLSKITLTITMIPEITEFTFSVDETNHTASVTGYTGSDSTVTIPSSISVVETTDGIKYYEGSQYTVTSIGYRAFYNNTTITNVVLPDTLQIIGSNAFSRCGNLSTINFGDLENLTTIGTTAFFWCTLLTNVIIHESVVTFGSYVFHGDSVKTLEYKGTLEQYLAINMGEGWIGEGNSSHKLIINGKEITGQLDIPNNTTAIPNSAFYGCDAITSVSIPESVTSIGPYAFRNCSNLATINLGDLNLSTISYGTFYNCSSLTEIAIPESVTNIEYEAFYNNDSLIEIEIPASVASIGYNVFESCSSLESIVFGENSQLTTIPYGMFRYCSSLINIAIPEGVISVDGASNVDPAFEGCSLKTLTLPSSLTTLGQNSLRGCDMETLEYQGSLEGYLSISRFGEIDDESHSLIINGEEITELVIPTGITSIISNAFYGCDKITNVTLPNTLTRIGSYVFYRCTSLTSITIPSSVTSIGAYAFAYCYYNLNNVVFEMAENEVWQISNTSWFTSIYEELAQYELKNPSTAADLLTTTHGHRYWRKVVVEG